jgi:hypothetical protein
MRSTVMVAVWLVAAAAGVAAFQANTVKQSDPAQLAGRWRGSVKTNIGEMPIGLELRLEQKKLVGTVPTAHGSFVVTDVKAGDGKWTVTFKADDDSIGTMTGAVKDDTFSGEWDFKPRAVGTFQLTKVKPKQD